MKTQYKNIARAKMIERQNEQKLLAVNPKLDNGSGIYFLTRKSRTAGGGVMNACKLCGRKPIIERWRSGGMMYMVKCNNPDCRVPEEGYPSGGNLDEVKVEWDKRNSK